MGKREFDMLREQYEASVRNLAGTFAVEGMTISKETRRNLDRISSGKSSYQQILKELCAKYQKQI